MTGWIKEHERAGTTPVFALLSRSPELVFGLAVPALSQV